MTTIPASVFSEFSLFAWNPSREVEEGWQFMGDFRPSGYLTALPFPEALPALPKLRATVFLWSRSGVLSSTSRVRGRNQGFRIALIVHGSFRK